MKKKQQKERTRVQIQKLMSKAAARPGPNDPLGMVGFGSVILAAQMHMLLQQEEDKEQ